MSEAVDLLKSNAISLIATERVDLAYYLLTSLEPDEESVEAAWHDEISRRIEEIRSDHAVGRPAEEVMAELRDRYR